MPRPWGSKVTPGSFVIYKHKLYHDQPEKTTVVWALDTTDMSTIEALLAEYGHPNKTPIAWLKDGKACGWYLCPKKDLRPATKREILSWQLSQL